MSDSNSESDRVEKTAGGHLREAREAAGWSVEEVALKLKLSTRQIAAIEAQDWEALPERTFTRGFFKSYARLVGVDESLIDPSFARATATPELLPRDENIGEVTVNNTTARSAISRWTIPIALLACLSAGIAWMVWHDIPLPQAISKLPREVAPNATKQAAPEPPANQSSQLAAASPNENVAAGNKSLLSTSGTNASPSLLPGAVVQEAINIPILNSAAANSAATPATSAAQPGTSPLSATMAQSPAPVAAPAVAPAITPSVAPGVAPTASSAAPPTASATVLSAGQKRVNLVVKGRAWTEVRSRGETVLSEMLNDTSREIASRGPISFVIGNSSNVTLSVDGKPYDFSMHVRNEVARFRIE
jgi:cytoskeleton protein RodZ